jgi:hypothetical protein
MAPQITNLGYLIRSDLRPHRGRVVIAAMGGRCTLAVVALAVVGSVLVSGCQDQAAEDSTRMPAQTTAPSADAPDQVRIGERLLLLRFAPGADRLANSGAAPLDVDEVTAGAGTARHEAGPHGGAIRLPAYESDPRDFAVVRVRSHGGQDWLRPGDTDFAFGALFSVDRESSGSPVDDGDNLLQRGLYQGPSIYKLQLDRHHLSCLVRGMRGELLVKAPDVVTPGQWYRARCLRRGDAVSLLYARVTDEGPEPWTVVTGRGPIGSVIMPRDTPLSIGGKLDVDGSLASSSTDQFNGAIDGAFFRLIGRS